MGRRARRGQRAEAAGTAPGGRRARSEQRDAAARAALVPLREGERPLAVTVGAAVAVLIVLANVVALALGSDVGGRGSTAAFFVVWTVLLLSIAWGMWRARYWAVLGMQALLAILVVIFSLFLVRAEGAADVALAGGVIAGAGTLFWFLVKAMARIQMPERR